MTAYVYYFLSSGPGIDWTLVLGIVGGVAGVGLLVFGIYKFIKANEWRRYLSPTDTDVD
jgi:hypothetical protein